MTEKCDEEMKMTENDDNMTVNYLKTDGKHADVLS